MRRVSDAGRGLWRSRWAAIGAAIAVTVGAGGVIRLAAASSEPSTFVAITPVRVLDTRTDVGLAGPFVSAISQDLDVTGDVATTAGTQIVVPVGATAVVMNVTAVSPTAAGFVAVRPADAPGAPTTSSLNLKAGDIVPNAVTVALPTSGPDTGMVELTFDAYGAPGPSTDILADVIGYYTANAPSSGAPEGPPTTT